MKKSKAHNVLIPLYVVTLCLTILVAVGSAQEVKSGHNPFKPGRPADSLLNSVDQFLDLVRGQQPMSPALEEPASLPNVGSQASGYDAMKDDRNLSFIILPSLTVQLVDARNNGHIRTPLIPPPIVDDQNNGHIRTPLIPPPIVDERNNGHIRTMLIPPPIGDEPKQRGTESPSGTALGDEPNDGIIYVPPPIPPKEDGVRPRGRVYPDSDLLSAQTAGGNSGSEASGGSALGDERNDGIIYVPLQPPPIGDEKKARGSGFSGGSAIGDESASGNSGSEVSGSSAAADKPFGGNSGSEASGGSALNDEQADTGSEASGESALGDEQKTRGSGFSGGSAIGDESASGNSGSEVSGSSAAADKPFGGNSGSEATGGTASADFGASGGRGDGGEEITGNQIADQPYTQPAEEVTVKPRESVQIDYTTLGEATGVAVASSGDLTAVAYVDCATAGANFVNVALSDGRGTEWSYPFRVDADRSSADKETKYDSIAVSGENIYVAWKDERYGSGNEELCFNMSDDSGSSWYGEFVVNKGYAPGIGALRDWNMVVTHDDITGFDYIYILMSVDPTGSDDEELYLVASHDSGFSFEAPVMVPQNILPGEADIDSIALAAEGMSVSVLWQDDRISRLIDPTPVLYNTIWYQQSSDGGASWMRLDERLNRKTGPTTVPTAADGEISIAKLGRTILAVWLEKRSSETADEIRANITIDGGETWLTEEDILIGEYEPGVDDADAPRAFFCRDMGEYSLKLPVPVVVWDDNRTGIDEVYAVSSMDFGESWEEAKLSSAGGNDPFPTGGNDSVCVVWTSGSYPSAIESACSIDAGQNWETSVTVSDNAGADAKYPAVAYDPVYNNFVTAWLSDDLGGDNLYVGGYRPQTLEAVGNFTAGGTVHFEAHIWPGKTALTGGNSNFSVLISGGKGNYLLPLGDGRNTGLKPDAYLYRSLAMAQGLLSGLMVGDGGTTQSFTFPGSVPPGTVLHCVAVEVYSSGSTTQLGKVTDVIEVLVH